MSSRKFFSGNTLDQAVLLAARHFGIEPDEVEYKEIEKKHGFLRSRKKHVIEAAPRSEEASEPESAPPSEAASVAEPEPEPEPVAEPEPKDPAPAYEPPSREPESTASAAEPPSREAEPAAESRWQPEPQSEPSADSRPESPGGDERPDAESSSEAETVFETAPGLPEVPSRWSKDPEPIGEPIESAASTPPIATEQPARPERPEPERESRPERQSRRERPERASRSPRSAKAEREPRSSRSGADSDGKSRKKGLTELPEGPRRARERLDQADGERADAARKAMEMLFELAAVELEAEVLQGEEGLEVEVWGSDQDLLFEDRGRLLLAFEHLLPRLIRGFTGRSIHCRVDSDSFHEIRAERLRDLAQRMASKVHRHGRSETLEPMAPDERRIVHLTLADDPTVETQSRGRGLFKRVSVNPVRGGGSRQSGPRY